LKIVLFIVFILSFSVSICSANWVLYSEVHEVTSEETLNDIVNEYISDNCRPQEFKEGIIEINYDKIFKERKTKEVKKGDVLQINYWVYE